LEPFAGLEGLEEEYLRCRQYCDAAALGADPANDAAMGEAGTVTCSSARRTDEGNMFGVDVEKLEQVRSSKMALPLTG